MTQQTKHRKRRPIRMLAATAAVVAALAVTVSAANLETVHAFIQSFTITLRGEDLPGKGPEVRLSERDGRTILELDGRELDITDDLARDGRYVHVDGPTKVEVTGSQGNWSYTITADNGNGIILTTAGGQAKDAGGTQAGGAGTASPARGATVSAEDAG